MPHVMLVEPEDDLCLFLGQAISEAGCRMTIVGSVAEATAALAGPDRVDQVITEAFLPDGSGLVLAQDVRRMGKPVFVLRGRRGRIVVYDRDGLVFIGDQTKVGAFIAGALLENQRSEPASTIDTRNTAIRLRGRRRRRQ
jgi:CheY-like chemotaxis protein